MHWTCTCVSHGETQDWSSGYRQTWLRGWMRSRWRKASGPICGYLTRFFATRKRLLIMTWLLPTVSFASTLAVTSGSRPSKTSVAAVTTRPITASAWTSNPSIRCQCLDFPYNIDLDHLVLCVPTKWYTCITFYAAVYTYVKAVPTRSSAIIIIIIIIIIIKVTRLIIVVLSRKTSKTLNKEICKTSSAAVGQNYIDCLRACIKKTADRI